MEGYDWKKSISGIFSVQTGSRNSCYVILHFPADESITNRRGGGGSKAASRIPLLPHQGAR